MTSLSIPSTRKTGRKIETWTFMGQDGNIHIDVYLHSDRSTGPKFTATSSHKFLAKNTWSDTDISRLAKTVETEIKAIFDELTKDHWRPCLLIEVDPDYIKSEGQRTTSVAMRVSEAQLDTHTPPGNDGYRRIKQKERITSMKECSFLEKSYFEGPNGRIKLDNDISRIFVQDTPQARQDIQHIQGTLEYFGQLLAQRLSPDHSSPNTLPTPEDLVDMMRKSANAMS